ncbi:MAG: hypothetical protein WAU41_14845 [Gaiellaceae bacterium]
MAPPTPDRPTGLQLVRQGLLRRPVAGGVEVLGRRLRRELDLNARPGEQVRLCVRGALGQALVCLDDRILIVKRGLSAGAAFGAISATIYYRDVTGVQIGRRIFSGWIEIHSPSFQGGDRTRTLQNPAKHDPFRQPNCLPMRRRHSAAYHESLAQIRGFVAGAKSEPERLPVIDQLERLAMLRRRGDIDEREFELAKARILGDASSRWNRAASS